MKEYTEKGGNIKIEVEESCKARLPRVVPTGAFTSRRVLSFPPDSLSAHSCPLILQTPNLPVDIPHPSIGSPLLLTLSSLPRQNPRLPPLSSHRRLLPLLPLHGSQDELEEIWLYRCRATASRLPRCFKEWNRIPPRFFLRKSEPLSLVELIQLALIRPQPTAQLPPPSRRSTRHARLASSRSTFPPQNRLGSELAI